MNCSFQRTQKSIQTGKKKKKKSISLYQFLLNPIISAGQLHTLFFSWCSITTNPSTLACSINHRMTEWLGFVGWEVRLVPTPAVGWWPPTNSGCRGPHPAQPWALIGMGYPQLSGQLGPLPHHLSMEFLPYIFPLVLRSIGKKKSKAKSPTVLLPVLPRTPYKVSFSKANCFKLSLFAIRFLKQKIYFENELSHYTHSSSHILFWLGQGRSRKGINCKAWLYATLADTGKIPFLTY